MSPDKVYPEVNADFLQNYIEAEGMQTGRKGNNVWCLSPMFDLKKPTILLNSHIDTVKPVNGWRKDPFTPREDFQALQFVRHQIFQRLTLHPMYSQIH